MPPSSVASTQGSAAPFEGTPLSPLSSTSAPRPAQNVTVRLFNPNETHLVPYLAAIHANCITADQAIVSFLPPIGHEELLKFWKDTIAEVARNERQMVVLFDESKDPPPDSPGLQLMGVVMLKTPQSETGPFRGWVEKLLVSPKFRRKGAATALMAKLEEEAVKRGRTLLMADTEHGKPSEELYRRLDYIEVGRIPHYSKSPGGGLRDQVFFYKHLA